MGCKIGLMQGKRTKRWILLLQGYFHMMYLPELEDQPWFPQCMRRQQLEYIAFMASVSGLYKPVLPFIEEAAEWDNGHITDLCSGQGGPAHYLLKHAATPLSIQLTDRFPDHHFFQLPNLHMRHKPLDVLSDPIPGSGAITLFNAFHHFGPTQQAALLQKIAATGRPLLVCEILQPTPWCLLRVLLATTACQVLLAPFVLPFRLSRLLLTWVLPVNIITVCFDGIISVLKALPAKRMQLLSQTCSHTSYLFTFRRLGGWLNPVYIIEGKAQAI